MSGSTSSQYTSDKSDIYSKGSNVLHTLRQLVGDDDKWREI